MILTNEVAHVQTQQYPLRHPARQVTLHARAVLYFARLDLCLHFEFSSASASIAYSLAAPLACIVGTITHALGFASSE